MPEDINIPAVPDFRDLHDYDTARKDVYAGVLNGLQTRYPIENDKYRLEIRDLRYDGPETYSLTDQKKAILGRRTLARPVKGTWTLVNKGTGQVADTYKSTIAAVPTLTQRGTYIINGNEYTLANQMRLKSGVYTRKKDNGEYEAHVNVLKGGPGFRVFMEPETGVYRMQVGQAKLKLYPVLRAMGVPDADLQKQWGAELFNANVNASDGTNTLHKVWDRLADARAKKETGENVEKDFKALFGKLEMDPAVMKRTLGLDHKNIQPETLLRITQKLLNISQGNETTDDRDSLAYQETWGADDLINDRITKDAGRLGSRLLWRATLRGNLSGLPSAALNPQLESLFYKSGLAQALEEINPLDNMDLNARVTRLGEGGMGSGEGIPEDARMVHPSQFLFIDGIRSPESNNVGVDQRFAINVYKGRDRQPYTAVKNVKSGKLEHVTPATVIDSTVAFPGELSKAAAEGRTYVRAMRRNRLSYVPINEVQYEAPSAQTMFSQTANLVPLTGSIKANRMLMAGKHTMSALPLKDAEAPLVQTADESGNSYYDTIAKHMGVVRSDVDGQVVNIDANYVTVKDVNGQLHQKELYDRFPLNRKTFLTNTPTVKPGDIVHAGQLLAKSNFTDNKGTVAIGKNLNVAYMPYKGYTYEDGIVISDSASKKLASEHMYTESIDGSEFKTIGRSKFLGVFPSKFTRQQVANIDERGVIKPGTTVNKDDPLILAVGEHTSKGAGMLHSSGGAWQDNSVLWSHDDPGVVTDVWQDKDGVKVAVQAYSPAREGDKMAGRHGNKGVISKVVPDNEMPQDATGQPLDVILNPQGIITRLNPAQLLEAVLGKIAAKRGKPYVLPAFTGFDNTEFVLNEMKTHGVSDKETVTDPAMNRKIPGVLVGKLYMMRLHHIAEDKLSGRGLGAYTAEGIPASGGSDRPKRIGLGEMQALISHGASRNIEEIKIIKGQKNDEYWHNLTLGMTPASPEVPAAYKRFMSLLRGAGINVQKKGEQLHLMAMTDKDVDSMSSGEITEPSTVRWMTDYGRGLKGEKSLDPVEGGLFDRGITGGHGGNRYSHITLAEPMPQPAMEKVVKSLLGLTQTEFENVLSGKGELQGMGTGGRAIQTALERIQLGPEIERQKEIIRSASGGSVRNSAIKKLKYLQAMVKNEINPKDLCVTKVPVIPPIFRPITANTKFEMVSGSNLLYMDLMHANKNHKTLSSLAEGAPVGESRLNLYKAFKAVVGLGDPIKPERVQQNIKGLLHEVFGSNPKFGVFQRKLLGTTVDMSARAVITPNPELNMDQIGMPEDKAWQLYDRFVTRRLIRQMGGRPDARAAAIKMVMDRTPQAKEMLLKEMASRPLLATRAPALHRFNIMAFYPILTTSKSLQLSPPVCSGYNADFDGDQMNFHVVVSDKAIDEVNRKLLPSRNVKGLTDFKPMYSPKIEYLQGLYQASTRKSGKRMVPVYAKASDVLSAFKRGELNADDAVSIKED